MSAPTRPRPISDLDVPLSHLEADIKALAARQRTAQTLHDAAERTHSPSDRLAYALDEWLITHPDAPLSTDADYPGWTPTGAVDVELPTKTASPAPTWPEDWDQVLDTAIRTWGGQWDTKRVQRLYLARYGRGMFRSHARSFLADRARRGQMTMHDQPNYRFYTLRGGDGR